MDIFGAELALRSDSDVLLTGDEDFNDITLERPIVLSPSTYYDLTVDNCHVTYYA